MRSYTFDITLTGTVHVPANSTEEALSLLSNTLDGTSANLGSWWPAGEPVLAELHLENADMVEEIETCPPTPRPSRYGPVIEPSTFDWRNATANDYATVSAPYVEGSMSPRAVYDTKTGQCLGQLMPVDEKAVAAAAGIQPHSKPA